MWWGFRQMAGMSTLEVHKRLDNAVEHASYVDQRHAELRAIEPGDRRLRPPPRARWLVTVRRVDYRNRLAEVRAPTLLLVGRHDPQTPPACSYELNAAVPQSHLVLFEHSGHAPFVEELQRFRAVVGPFLARDQ